MTLKGKRIIITRAEHQYGEFADLLRKAGAEPFAYPAIAVALPEDTTVLDQTLKAAARGEFDLIVFTSANTVQMIASRLASLGINLQTRAAVVGAATGAAVARTLRLPVETIPQTYDAHSLASALQIEPGTRVFIPQSEIASTTLVNALRERGAQVTLVDAYRVVQGEGGVNLPRIIQRMDAITFTSGSTVHHFVNRFINEGGKSEGGKLEHLSLVTRAVMGKSARDALQTYHLTAHVHAEKNTLNSLVAALEDYFHAE